jgi:hypothetical protein
MNTARTFNLISSENVEGTNVYEKSSCSRAGPLWLLGAEPAPIVSL